MGYPKICQKVGNDFVPINLQTSIEQVTGWSDDYLPIFLDGTIAKYRQVMKAWFLSNGADTATPAQLTALVDRWYKATRPQWNGWVQFYKPSVSAISTGTKYGDNANMSCTPSTNTTANQDDYAGNPLFAITNCNYTVNATTLEPVIVDIENITDNYESNNPAKYVGVLQMSGYHWWTNITGNSDYYLEGYSSTYINSYSNIMPLPESVRASDNTVRQWVLHSKYMASLTSTNALTSCSGVQPASYVISHNTLHTYAKNNGAQYSGSTICDNAFLILMAHIKYASLTLEGIMNGCNNYNIQLPAQVSESGVNRVLIPYANKSSFEVGSTVIIGNYTTALDRSNAGMYSISGTSGYTITSIEDVTINSTAYSAVYVNSTSTFTTTANGASTAGTTYISSMGWHTGSCDLVLGNDGSPNNCTNNQEVAMLQGIEFMCGFYETYADVILSLYQDSSTSTYYYQPYTVSLSANQSTAITSNYTASGLVIAQVGSNWIEYQSTNGILYFPTILGGSSSTYMKDYFYMSTASVGTREWLAFGYLNYGANAGLSYLNGVTSLVLAYWHVASRLSCNGNRGEFSA